MNLLTVPLQLGSQCVDLKLVMIPAGEFIMGSNEGRALDDWTDTPMGEFKVILTRHYWIGIYPVTQCQWKTIMHTEPSHFKGDNLPVESIAWEEAVEFCNRLNATLLPDLNPPNNYLFRLPTEAEWEYACKAGLSNKYQLGDTLEDLSKVAWHRDNIPTLSTQAVGQKLPNQWGLYDMLGNVREMCFDRPVEYPDGTTQIDWVGNSEEILYNVRGGCAFNEPGVEDHLTWYGRGLTGPEPDRFLGFRLCLGPDIKRQK